jgi:NADPH:quinone reductase-like Zn-dependent oxidoreductase
MKAAIFEKPGLENLRVTDNAEQPKISDHDILIKVKLAGINPIDHFGFRSTAKNRSTSAYTGS